jgi:hypothetical protein
MNTRRKRRLTFSPAIQIFDLQDEYAQARWPLAGPVRPIGPVRLLLIERIQGGQAVTFERPLELRLKRNASGFDLFFGEVREVREAARPDEAWRRLADGKYTLRVETPLYQDGTLEVDFPMPDPASPQVIVLVPGHAYPFSTATILPKQTDSNLPIAHGQTLVRGAFFHADGSGVANAVVEITAPALVPARTYRTGTGGQWVLPVPVSVFQKGPAGNGPNRNITLRFRWPDPANSAQTLEHTWQDLPVTMGRETSVLQTGLRGWVTAAGRGVGDVTISVSDFPGQSRSQPDGSWFYYFNLQQPPANLNQVTVNAVLPDGTAQALVTPIRHGATTQVATIRFD